MKIKDLKKRLEDAAGVVCLAGTVDFALITGYPKNLIPALTHYRELRDNAVSRGINTSEYDEVVSKIASFFDSFPLEYNQGR